ncbi:glycosyltransferase family 2 protein [Dacryopinax primogenitus]|uniref:chitin synthase n=1 Tax=Dacryopinax primogenitus (strain DJM 731) TaxID=1858805 RepID=M5G045_DACPD|nr:glycosyltransferase family 2 protein [Dacryopinax primogenitus]EJU01525.1 glycosyltransferase family 2 protein [Dacryopinax primogenitus]
MSVPRPQDINDLALSPSTSDDVLVSVLRERFLSDTVYTAIGSSALVVVNPYKYVSSNADNVLLDYAAEYRDTDAHDDRHVKPPHIFQLANNAYFHMRRTNMDQCILLSGESGSGKSETRRLAIKSILELSVTSPGKKGGKMATQIPSGEYILESFGNARTLQNPNASRFGKYTELQFSERGRLCGIKTLDYYLEKSRVAGAPGGERNFHVFYYLCSGASQEERQHLKLADKSTFRYLGQRPTGGREAVTEDSQRFDRLKMAMKSVGLSKRHIAQTFQLLAAILHLGNIDFTMDKSRNEDAAVVKNVDQLEIVADFLGVQPHALEAVMQYKTKLVHKELCTIFLDPEGAGGNRDDLAKTLYSLLFALLNETMNQNLCRDDFLTFIGLFDLPGFQNISSSASRTNSLDQFCVNFANERLQNWVQKRIFERNNKEYEAEEIASLIPTIPFFDNSECIRLMSHQPGGLIHIMDDQARRQPKKNDHTMVEAFSKRWGNHSSFRAGQMDRSGFPTFTVNHYVGPVTYSAESWLERDTDALNPDFVSLLRGATLNADESPPLHMGGSEVTGSINPFVRSLFSAKAIATQAHPYNEDTIVAAQQPVMPMRAPSTRRKQSVRRARASQQVNSPPAVQEDEEPPREIKCVAGEFRTALDVLFETLDETQAWFVFCINPNDSQLPNQMEGRGVKAQVRSLGLPEVAKRLSVSFEASMTPIEFCDRYKSQMVMLGIGIEDDFRERITRTRDALDLGEQDVVVGKHKVFLSHTAFHVLENYLRASDIDEQKRNRNRELEREEVDRPTFDPFAPYSPLNAEVVDSPHPGVYHNPRSARTNSSAGLVMNAAPFRGAALDDGATDDGRSYRSGTDYDTRSRATSQKDEVMSMTSYAPTNNMFHNMDKQVIPEKDALPGEALEGETTEDLRESVGRRRWVFFCWMLTFWIPSFILSFVGRMKRMDIRQAWREKVAINMIIWFVCGCAIFVIAILGNLICPTQYVFSTSELQSHSFQNNPSQLYTAIRGEVFDLTNIAALHLTAVSVVPTKLITNYGGEDATSLFPVQVSALCNGVSGSVNPYVILDSTNTTTNIYAQYHDFRAFTNDYRPDWYFETMVMMRYKFRVGFMGYVPQEISDMANSGRAVAIYNGEVYEMTSYINIGPQVKVPNGFTPPTGIDTQFMSQQVQDLFTYNSGQDITKQLNSLNMDPTTLADQKTCLRNLFLIGKVDNRNSPQCLFANYILLALSVMMVSIIGFKFLAALQFGSARAPEDHDKFVICQIPCYTEGEDSLKKTIDSMAKLRYDDKRKLLFVICDGMIVGSGNDRPTPRIVLDILGADPNRDQEPLSFLSLGEGAKQHNMGKVYSGLYECEGHVVPYIVLVKVGKPTERSRPGNRGKRDSQMVLMHFLNKVHFNSPMNPLELEIYHQIKNVIGVNPTFYEYLFMVDADTTVDPMSLNRLISAMMHDKKVLGVCGETALSNARHSIVTMMQVYEYFISHHMAKAFESLFGSVTCLPGCFTLYRLRTPDSKKPLFISNQVIEEYSENRVDTLHMKNLLHLGEDRYLTTLLLKHFPNYKTQFVRDAHAWTVAPDEWKILLSQRRRWINSTVHNLAELVFLERLCGFCCFSMRFVVFIDLLSTLIQPVTVAYIVYLIVLVAGEHKPLPTISIILLAAVYGLQALVFIVRRKWDMVGWMFFYILAIPAFSFFLPLYSFWRMDDFSWGATRVVLGEKGKKMVVHDEGKFDPKAIPLKSWSDFENELWDKESNHSIGSWVPPKPGKEDYESRADSVYGRETYYDPDPYSRSRAPSQNMMHPPAFASGRNSPADVASLRPSMRGQYAANAYGSRPGSQVVYDPPEGYPPPNYPPSRQAFSRLPSTQSGLANVLNYDDQGANDGLPSDAEIEAAIRDILREADLNTVTKRGVRQQLERVFGIDLGPKKSFVNATIDRLLLNPV